MVDPPPHVWYAGYGSNLDPDRFRCYLQGGSVQGMVRPAAGSRDRSVWSGRTTGRLPGPLRFAGSFTAWGDGEAEGGAAFLGPFDAAAPPPGAPEPVDEAFPVHAVAYRITPSQLVDVLLQESGRDPTDDRARDIVAAVERDVFGFLHEDGRRDPQVPFDVLQPEALSGAAYGRLVRLPLVRADGARLAVHVVAATSSLPERDPVPEYLAVMRRGLVGTVGLGPSEADAYLAARLAAGGTGSGPTDRAPDAGGPTEGS